MPGLWLEWRALQCLDNSMNAADRRIGPPGTARAA